MRAGRTSKPSSSSCAQAGRESVGVSHRRQRGDADQVAGSERGRARGAPARAVTRRAHARRVSVGAKERGGEARKPSSVSLPWQVTVIPLGTSLPGSSSDLPGSVALRRVGRAAHLPLPYLVLLRMGFAVPPPSPAARCALTAPFHPYRSFRRTPGGLFSVALSVASPRLAVSEHAARGSSDFPLPEGSDRLDLSVPTTIVRAYALRRPDASPLTSCRRSISKVLALSGPVDLGRGRLAALPALGGGVAAFSVRSPRRSKARRLAIRLPLLFLEPAWAGSRRGRAPPAA